MFSLLESIVGLFQRRSPDVNKALKVIYRADRIHDHLSRIELHIDELKRLLSEDD